MSYLIDDGVWGQTGAVEAQALVGDVMSRPLAQNVYLRQNVNILGIVPQVRKVMKMDSGHTRGSWSSCRHVSQR